MLQKSFYKYGKRRQTLQWMNDLTIAVIEKDCFKIGELIKALPEFTDINTAKNALALIAEAIVVVENERNETFATMQKIKQTKAFLMEDEAKKPRFIV